MTDELERLLGEEQKEPEQVAEVLKFRAEDYSLPPKEKATAAETEEETVVAVSGESERAFLFGQSRRTDEEEQLRREENAGTLYQTLTRMRRAVRGAGWPRESSRTPLVRQSTPATDPGRDALWLDRIFQRDARRYDGGFTWQ